VIRRFSRPSRSSRKAEPEQDLRQPAPCVAHHLPTDTCKTDPDLAAVVSAWPDLPEAIRSGIVAMVKAASANGGNRKPCNSRSRCDQANHDR